MELESSMEAGDEEIDWNHTRMLSLGFFPSILTDEDVGYLINPFDAVETERVMQRMHSWKDGRLLGGALGGGVTRSLSDVVNRYGLLHALQVNEQKSRAATQSNVTRDSASKR